ncbi:MAG TPA: hypothetical protein VF589_02680 [Allosphingosinicella sp.]|jgi:carbamate kinase
MKRKIEMSRRLAEPQSIERLEAGAQAPLDVEQRIIAMLSGGGGVPSIFTGHHGISSPTARAGDQAAYNA